MSSAGGATWSGLLRHPGYARYFVAVALARVPSTMWAVAVALLVLEHTGSLSLAGVTVAAGSLPAAFSGPVLGAWLDVARSRRALIALDQLTAIGALIGILLVAGNGGPRWTLPVLALAYGVTSPLSMGAFRSVLPELVRAEQLPKANTMEATAVNLAYIVGPAVAGVIAGTAGPAAAIEVQIALFAATIALTATAQVFELRPATPPSSVMASVREGLRALWRIVPLRAVAASSFFSVMGWGTLNVGFAAYGIAVGAGAHAAGYMWAAVSVGSVVSAFAFARFAARVPTVALIGGSSCAMACSALLWPAAASLPVALVLVTLTGLLEGPALAAYFTVRQRFTPPAVRGQVFSTVGSLNFAGIAIGSALAGAVHAALGTDATLWAFSVFQLLSAAWLLMARRELRGSEAHN